MGWGAVPESSHPSPRRLIVFPGWFRSNPYLNMLYLIPRTRGYAVDSPTRIDDLLALVAGAGRGTVLHIHWTAPITQYAPDAREGQRRLRAFRRAVHAARRRHARLVWTVHNRLPHECPYPDLERELLRFLAAEADLIIAINPLTRQLMSDLVELDPARLAFLPHPAYRGLYPDEVTRQEARDRLGLSEDRSAVLFFGQMRRYKGLHTYFESMTRVHDDGRPVTMLLAGKTLPADLEWIEEALPARVPAIRDHRFIPDSEIQYWFHAADAVVLPFENVLNSGSVFLCASFGRSVVMPRQPQIEAEFGDQEWVRLYDNVDPRGLDRAIVEALDAPDAESAALAFAAGRSAYRFSLAYDELLRHIEPTG